jgi:hypothetical protein
MSYSEGLNKESGLIWGENVFADENGLVTIGNKNQHDLQRKYEAGRKEALTYQLLIAQFAPMIDILFDNRRWGKDIDITVDGKTILTFHADGSVTDHR